MRRTLPILTLLITSLACVLTTPGTGTPSAPGAIETSVAGTMAAITTPAPAESAGPQVTAEASVPAATGQPGASTPAPLPTIPASAASGGDVEYFWAYDGASQSFVLYDRQGVVLLSFGATDFSAPEKRYFHAANSLQPGQPVQPRLVYYSADQGGVIKVHDGIQSAVEVAAPQLVALVGRPGTPTIAYSLLTISGALYQSALYVKDLGAPAPTKPLLETSDPDGYVLFPLAMDGQSLWYTLRASDGISAFPMQRGLWQVDLATGQSTMLLDDMSYRLFGFDPATGMVAYAGMAADVPNAAMLWGALNDSSNHVYHDDLWVPQTVGPNHAVFSQGGYIAWADVLRGNLPEVFKYLKRVYTWAGQPVAEEPPTASSVIHPGVHSAWPVAWLDASSSGVYVLVLQGMKTVTGPPVILLADPGMANIVTVPGTFLGAAYAAP